jgi:hypothetical protein
MKIPGPWIGVALIALGIATAIAFAHWHVVAGEIVGAVVTLGIAVIQANMHVQQAKENVMLRESMRPPPSLVDSEERRG